MKWLICIVIGHDPNLRGRCSRCGRKARNP